MSGQTEEGHFMRSQAYRSLRNFTRFYMGKEKHKNVPAVSEIASPASRGYLWRLSTKRMVYTHDWKRKYFVLTGDKLYYYDNELGDGVGPGAGVIHLECFIDCVEAPLTDHKKATNVFILLAKERGLFEQGRYYLSAETLIDMKTWVSRIRSAIRNISRKEGKLSVGEVSPSSITASQADTGEPEYASIKDYRIHRSNSMSTLPSLCRDEAGERLKCLNRSMHEDIDHNLTYSYSSSEDSLNESFSINFTPKKPRSAGGVRSPLYATPSKVKPEIRISSGRPGPGHHLQHLQPTSTPSKAVDTSAYLQKMYQDMDRVDKQLELVAKLESGKADIAKFDEDDDEMEDSENMEVDINRDMNVPGNDHKMQRMEEMMKDLNQQSEDLQKMFRKLTAKRHSVATVEAPGGASSSSRSNVQEEQIVMSALLDSLARYQDVMNQLQSQAKQLMTEIKTTHTRVLQSLAESQVAKKNFLELKQKAEVILAQLQQEESKAFYPSESQYPLYATVRKDRKGKGPKVTIANPVRNTTMVDTTLPEEETAAGASPYQLRPRSLMLSYK